MFGQVLANDFAEIFNLVPLLFVCLLDCPLWDALKVHLEHEGRAGAASPIDRLQDPTSYDQLAPRDAFLNRFRASCKLLVSVYGQHDLAIMGLQLS